MHEIDPDRKPFLPNYNALERVSPPPIIFASLCIIHINNTCFIPFTAFLH